MPHAFLRGGSPSARALAEPRHQSASASRSSRRGFRALHRTIRSRGTLDPTMLDTAGLPGLLPPTPGPWPLASLASLGSSPRVLRPAASRARRRARRGQMTRVGMRLALAQRRRLVQPQPQPPLLQQPHLRLQLVRAPRTQPREPCSPSAARRASASARKQPQRLAPGREFEQLAVRIPHQPLLTFERALRLLHFARARPQRLRHPCRDISTTSQKAPARDARRRPAAARRR